MNLYRNRLERASKLTKGLTIEKVIWIESSKT